MYKIFSFKYFIFLFILTICIPQIVLADIPPTSYTVSITANVIDETVEGVQNNNGPSGYMMMPMVISFEGKSSPLSKIYISTDGGAPITTTTDVNAGFNTEMIVSQPGFHFFNIYGEDINKVKTSTFSIPIIIDRGTTVSISNILLSPTINLDKIKVKSNEKIEVTGQSIPNNKVFIYSKGEKEYLYEALTDSSGLYKYSIDASILKLGDYNIKSKYLSEYQMSADTNILTFSVSDKSSLNSLQSCSSLVSDLNCDYRVDIKDFAIMSSWYKKTNFPKRVDLNRDGFINLVDFSIMTFNWTG